MGWKGNIKRKLGFGKRKKKNNKEDLNKSAETYDTHDEISQVPSSDTKDAAIITPPRIDDRDYNFTQERESESFKQLEFIKPHREHDYYHGEQGHHYHEMGKDVDNGREEEQEVISPRKLLDDLNIVMDMDDYYNVEGATEIYLNETTIALEPKFSPYNPDRLPPRGAENDLIFPDDEQQYVGDDNTRLHLQQNQEGQRMIPDGGGGGGGGKSAPSATTPRVTSRQLDPKPERRNNSILHSTGTGTESGTVSESDDDDSMTEEARCVGPEEIKRKLLSAFVSPCTTLPEPLDAACTSLRESSKSRQEKESTLPVVKPDASYYNEQFALDVLEELLNVGYALIYYQQVPEHDGDWIGRSVTFLLRPGLCSSFQLLPPKLEWTTLGGGQHSTIETFQVSLLDIHSIFLSSDEDILMEAQGDDDDDGDSQELKCFFTITSKSGKVHVLEAITTDDSQRLVTGIRNLAARLSRQIIQGDTNVLTDFYDSKVVPEGSRFPPAEAMMRLSHSLFDIRE